MPERMKKNGAVNGADQLHAAIFDVDGVLVFSRAANRVYWPKVIKQVNDNYGTNFPEPTPERVDRCAHNTPWDTIVRLTGLERPDDIRKVWEVSQEVEYPIAELGFPEELESTLNTLRSDMDLGLGIATNGSDIVDYVFSAKPEIEGYFDPGAIIRAGGPADATNRIKPKPNAESLLLAAEGLEVEPEGAIFVGDTRETDIVAAINANMRSIHIARTYEEGDVWADVIVIKFRTIPTAIAGITRVIKGT